MQYCQLALNFSQKLSDGKMTVYLLDVIQVVRRMWTFEKGKPCSFIHCLKHLCIDIVHVKIIPARGPSLYITN